MKPKLLKNGESILLFVNFVKNFILKEFYPNYYLLTIKYVFNIQFVLLSMLC